MNRLIPREDHRVPRTRAHWVSLVLPVVRIQSVRLLSRRNHKILRDWGQVICRCDDLVRLVVLEE